MLKKNSSDLQASGVLNKLVSDYLKRTDSLANLYQYYPDLKGYKALLESKPYANFDRARLSNLLLKQADRTNNISESSLANIRLIGQGDVFTVTTGHQLCLFTGPLYFFYKILSAINLAEALNTQFPGKRFVPVYWMASEDHDFEEVNHFFVNGKKLEWSSTQTGAVGDFETSDLKQLAIEFEKQLGRSEQADYLLQLFNKAYLEHSNLADATRYLVNELFGNYGLVVIDGNDQGFKQQFIPQIEADIFDNLAFHVTEPAIQSLQKQGYSIQVKPRNINCFYLEKGTRVRIEKQENAFVLVGKEQRFSPEALKELIHQHPEKISPNVVLRPLYQQIILPNIAYIGGPGELAYWLEFKTLFDKSEVVFPVLHPRNFVSVVDKVTLQKLKKLELPLPSIFLSPAELTKQIQVKNNAYFEIDTEEKELENLYERIRKRLTELEKTLDGAVSAELKRSKNGFERLSAKANRAHRRHLETDLQRIKQIKDALFPGGVPQERKVNFSDFYLSFGKELIPLLKRALDPLQLEQVILVED